MTKAVKENPKHDRSENFDVDKAKNNNPSNACEEQTTPTRFQMNSLLTDAGDVLCMVTPCPSRFHSGFAHLHHIISAIAFVAA